MHDHYEHNREMHKMCVGKTRQLTKERGGNMSDLETVSGSYSILQGPLDAWMAEVFTTVEENLFVVHFQVAASDLVFGAKWANTVRV